MQEEVSVKGRKLTMNIVRTCCIYIQIHIFKREDEFFEFSFNLHSRDQKSNKIIELSFHFPCVLSRDFRVSFNSKILLRISEFFILVVLLAEILFNINGSAERKGKRGINEKYANLCECGATHNCCDRQSAIESPSRSQSLNEKLPILVEFRFLRALHASSIGESER